MGQSSNIAPRQDVDLKSEIVGSSKLTIDNVEVVTKRYVVNVPVLEEVKTPTTKYETVIEPTIKYETKIEPTTFYEEVTKDTINFIVKEHETIRYNVKEVECERPIIIDKTYERPIIVEKEHVLITFKDIEIIKEAMKLLPDLLEEIKKLRKVRIVEEVVKVPKIEYIPTTVHRITSSGELIKDAN